MNWFISGQRIRLDADLGRVKARTLSLDPEVEDRRLRLQLQLSF